MQNKSEESASIESDENTYSRNTGFENQIPPRFEGSNVPVGNFPKEMLNHQKPTLKKDKSSKSLLNNKYGKRIF